ncbi:MAG TPA: hydrogenase nickel incorporation protein HypB [Methanomassiliicoccales archaeon]|nr:hydrogenase nickel incorporation protein HypB [Methanomassiliicoccales archaeon]
MEVKSASVHKITHISMETDVLAENKHLAEHNLQKLRGSSIRSMDVMGTTGAGKTALIIKLSKLLMDRGLRVAVIAGDVAGQDDYDRFHAAGVKAFNLNTGKECHLDANLLDHALDDIDLMGIDFLFIENVGNLVCPADFPLGTDLRLVVISVTEGDDMVRKHPMIFQEADIAVLNKLDIAAYMEIDVDRVRADYRKLSGGKDLHTVSVRTGEGLNELVSKILG